MRQLAIRPALEDGSQISVARASTCRRGNSHPEHGSRAARDRRSWLMQWLQPLPEVSLPAGASIPRWHTAFLSTLGKQLNVRVADRHLPECTPLPGDAARAVLVHSNAHSVKAFRLSHLPACTLIDHDSLIAEFACEIGRLTQESRDKPLADPPWSVRPGPGIGPASAGLAEQNLQTIWQESALQSLSSGLQLPRTGQDMPD